MKKFVLIITCALLCTLFVACGPPQIKDDPCMKPEAVDSVICAKLRNIGISVYDANLLFKLANMELVKHNAYAKGDCLRFLNNIESILDSTTYNEVVMYIVFQVEELKTKYGAELFLLMDYFSRFEGIEIPITEFDKGLLREHIRQQRLILGMLTETELDRIIEDAAYRADVKLGLAK